MIVRLFNRMGKPIGQLEPESAARAWRLNEISQASVSVPRTSPKIQEPLLRFGNLMTIESEDAPIWGGVILPPRKWEQDYVTITAYSGERLLKNRVLPESLELIRKAGGIFKGIIDYVHNNYQPNLDAGEILHRGRLWDRHYHFDDAWEAVYEIAQTADQEFWVEPYYDDNTGWLRFWGHWHKKRGKDKSKKIALIEGVNIGKPDILNENSEIFNEWICYSGPWKALDVGRYLDADAAEYSGRWTGAEEIADCTDEKALTEKAEGEVDKAKYVKGAFQVICTNLNDLWAEIYPGDTVWLQTSTVGWGPDGEVGYRGKARILSCSLNEAQGYMVVVLERDAKWLYGKERDSE